MIVRILGSAAGGGFPQWNCTCPGCTAARRGDGSALPRTQSSIAIAPDEGPWLLVNASPDLRLQLEALRADVDRAKTHAPAGAGVGEATPVPGGLNAHASAGTPAGEAIKAPAAAGAHARARAGDAGAGSNTQVSGAGHASAGGAGAHSIAGPRGHALVRASPIAGVLLTDAEIDHTTGLLLLREWGAPIPLWSTATTRRALTEGFPVLPTLEGYAGVSWRELVPGETVRLDLGAVTLEIEPFALGGDPPLYLHGAGADRTDWAIGVTVRDPTTGGVLTYAPGLDALDDDRRERFARADLLLVDGTCWRDDELPALGISARTARDMRHLPLSGPDGTLEGLRRIPHPRKVLVHINNTNPILREGSEERRATEAAGVEVGEDGMTFRL